MLVQVAQQKQTSTTTSTTTTTCLDSFEPSVVSAMKEALKKHGSGSNHNNNKNNASSSLLKRSGNKNKNSAASTANTTTGTGTAGSTPPKENHHEQRRSSPTNNNTSQENNNNKIRMSSSPSSSSSSASPTNKNNNNNMAPESTPSRSSPLSTPTTMTTAVPPNATTTAAENNNMNDNPAIPPSSTLAMRAPLQLLRTTRSAIEATTTSPNSSTLHIVAESMMLRRQSSLPATPSSSIVNDNNNNTPANSSPLHRLDRFGFIVNMDRHGNILPNTDDDINDHDDSKEETQPDNKTAKSRGRRSRTGNGSDAASSSLQQQQQQQSSSAVLAIVKRTKKREQKWQFMMDHWSVISNIPSDRNLIKTRRRRKVITRLRKGLPDKYRALVWKLLGNVPQKMKDNAGLYQLLVQRATHGVVTNAAAATPSTTDHHHHNASNDHNSTATTAGTTVRTGIGGAAAAIRRGRNLPDTVEVDTETNNHEELVNGAITGPSSVRHSKSFRNIQDTIERDIHRTFPRHSMFYEEEKNHGSIPSHARGGGGRVASNIGGSLLTDLSGSHFSEEDNLMLCGIGSEISETMRELERGAAGAASAVTARVGAAVAATNAATNNPGHDNGLLTTEHQRQQQQQQQQSDLVNSDDSDNPSPETILQSVGGQASLRRVLKAYSLYDRDIGYCQGMNFIAGMFLTLMSEEEAFWLLVDIMNEPPCKMRGLFGEGMSETHQVLHVAEKLIQQFLPKLSKHLERELIHVTMFATQWLLTQYTSSFKFDLVTRVWDCFLAEGWKITYRVMLALLKQWEGEILKMSFEDILAFFRELPERIEDIDALMELAFKIPLRRSHIAKYEKEWGQMQQQQQAQSLR